VIKPKVGGMAETGNCHKIIGVKIELTNIVHYLRVSL
jgi:hypothetical protein